MNKRIIIIEDINNNKREILNKEIENADLKKTIREIMKKYDVEEKGCLLHVNRQTYSSSLEYYYNKENKIEFNKCIIDVPINEFDDYEIDLKDKIEIVFVDGIGAAGGIDEGFISLYNNINQLINNNPLLVMAVVPTAKYIVKKITEYISEKCTFKVFSKALYHKKELTEKDVYKSFGLKDIIKYDKDTKKTIKILLEYMGYKYDKSRKVWILNDKEKKF